MVTCVLNQIICFLTSGIATPFITCIPTEVSEHWFAGRQRTLITAVLGMGDCFGLILGSNKTKYDII